MPPDERIHQAGQGRGLREVCKTEVAKLNEPNLSVKYQNKADGNLHMLEDFRNEIVYFLGDNLSDFHVQPEAVSNSEPLAAQQRFVSR
ncbi:hypothetical protein [Inhella sp.]|uniref:hypothetical protein n=1 Tax=Inhella sp. TaxID=1921806 RepID=UPI0035B14A6A